MQNPIFLIDTWESGGDLDENILLQNGVSGLIIRLNNMNGGHHMDTNFFNQWEQAKNFPVRIPYFVYNAWVSGQENFDWLISHIPSECGSVMLDVEVEYPGYSPTTYSNEFLKFYNLVKSKFNTMIYTGAAYLDLLSSWPQNALWWWAQYPNEFYVDQTIAWEQLRQKLLNYNLPFNSDKVPGTLKMWQFTGDKMKLPGCPRVVDVNVYYGDIDELKSFTNEKISTTPSPLGDVLLLEKTYFDGAIYKKYETIKFHGKAIYHLMEIESDKTEFFVSPQLTARKYVPDFLTAFDLDFAVNGDGFVSTTIAGYASSEGKPYGKLGIEEPIYISKDNIFSFTKSPVLWNAISHPNRLVIDGNLVPINKDVNDIRARTAWGYTKDQKTVFFLWCDGADYLVKEGLNFQECAEILKKLGCDIGVMNDGGGSTTASVNNNGTIEILGIPYGEDQPLNPDGSFRYPGYKLRRVANVLGVRMKTIPIPEIPPVEIPENKIKKVTIEYNDQTYISNNFTKL